MNLLFGTSTKSTGTPITSAANVRPGDKRDQSPIRGSMKAMADLFHFDYRGQDTQATAVAAGSGKPPAEKLDSSFLKDARLMIQRAHRVIIFFPSSHSLA